MAKISFKDHFALFLVGVVLVFSILIPPVQNRRSKNLRKLRGQQHKMSSTPCKQPGEFLHANGTCLGIPSFGDYCKFTRPLRIPCEPGLVCRRSKCECIYPEDQHFNQDIKKCISYPGHRCDHRAPSDHACEEKSSCESINVDTDYSLESQTSEIVDEYRCKCHKTFILSKSTQKCLGAHGTECQSDEDCYQEGHLSCVDSTCQCRNVLHEAWNSVTKTCYLLVNTPCVPGDELKCADHSECTVISGHKTGKCECSEAYSPTPVKSCLLSYGQKCDGEDCNVYNGLACVNSTCQCMDGYLNYDEKKMACVAMESSPCGPVTFNHDIVVFIECHHGLTCEKSMQVDNISSTCILPLQNVAK